MKGALRVAILFFTSLGIQRVLLWIGGAAILVGYLLPMPAKIVVIIVGCVAPLLPAAFLSGILLRHFVTPRAMRLIPHARGQVLGGMALAVGTIATVAALIGWSLGAPPVALWLQIATLVSLALLTQFPLTASIPGMVIWWVVLSGFSQGVKDTNAREFIAAIARSNASMMGLLAIAWTVFGVWFTGVRTFKPPSVLHQGKRIYKVDNSYATAIRTFLVGNPSVFSLFSGGLIAVLIIAVTWTLMRHFVGSQGSFANAATGGLAAAQSLGIYTGIGGILVVNRSKFLWLRGNVDREGLFRLCERYAWYFYGATAVSVLALLLLMLLIDPTHIAKHIAVMCFHLGMGACGLYLGLMLVRGRQALDVFFAIALLFGWGATNAFLVASPRSPAIWALVFAVTAAVALAFRLIAAHRWRNIDWLVCKPPRLGMRGLHQTRWT